MAPDSTSGAWGDQEANVIVRKILPRTTDAGYGATTRAVDRQPSVVGARVDERDTIGSGCQQSRALIDASVRASGNKRVDCRMLMGDGDGRWAMGDGR